jgi:phosphoribosylaminoimidazole carboxylase PurE protein
MTQKAVVIMGSKSDFDFCEKIKGSFEKLSIPCELRIASAHRTTRYLLDMLHDYQRSGDQVVFVTVAGLSDALSGVVAAQRIFPVVACPPDIEKHGYAKIFSSAYTPSDVPVAFVDGPEKVANFVGQIFAMSNPELAKSISLSLENKKKQITDEDSKLVDRRN